MPYAQQICSREGIEGTRFLRYQEEIVDCVRSARSASSYSVQPFSKRISVIFLKISIVKTNDYTIFILRLFVDF